MSQIKASLAAKAKWDLAKAKAVTAATEEWITINRNPEMMLFLGLYWGEGAKSLKLSVIEIVNNDPGVMKFSLDLFNKFSTSNKEIYIRCYPDQDLEQCKAYWESILLTKVKIKVRKEIGKFRKPTSKYGTATIRFSDWKFRYRIITWLNLLRQSLVGNDTEHITQYHTHYKQGVA